MATPGGSQSERLPGTPQTMGEGFPQQLEFQLVGLSPSGLEDAAPAVRRWIRYMQNVYAVRSSVYHFYWNMGPHLLREFDPAQVALERLEDVEQRQERLETQIMHGVQPTLAQFTKFIEGYTERDALPAASSAQYEWHSQVIESLKTIQQILEVFEELRERLSSYVILQQQLRELLRLARSMSDRNLRSAVLTVHDAVHGTYSEDLTIEQVQVIRGSLERLREVKWDREEVRSLDRALRSAGFETVPSDRFKYTHYV